MRNVNSVSADHYLNVEKEVLVLFLHDNNSPGHIISHLCCRAHSTMAKLCSNGRLYIIGALSYGKALNKSILWLTILW